MKILIKSGPEALLHDPQQPTYAIRLDSDIRRLKVLKTSEFYKVIKKYSFGDINPDKMDYSSYSGEIFFNESIAEKIIKYFKDYKNGCLELLVHCSAGLGRSPAVAIALNDIFDLDNDFSDKKIKYPRLNHYIYDKMIFISKNIKKLEKKK